MNYFVNHNGDEPRAHPNTQLYYSIQLHPIAMYQKHMGY